MIDENTRQNLEKAYGLVKVLGKREEITFEKARDIVFQALFSNDRQYSTCTIGDGNLLTMPVKDVPYEIKACDLADKLMSQQDKGFEFTYEEALAFAREKIDKEKALKRSIDILIERHGRQDERQS